MAYSKPRSPISPFGSIGEPAARPAVEHVVMVQVAVQRRRPRAGWRAAPGPPPRPRRRARRGSSRLRPTSDASGPAGRASRGGGAARGSCSRIRRLAEDAGRLVVLAAPRHRGRGRAAPVSRSSRIAGPSMRQHARGALAAPTRPSAGRRPVPRGRPRSSAWRAGRRRAPAPDRLPNRVEKARRPAVSPHPSSQAVGIGHAHPAASTTAPAAIIAAAATRGRVSFSFRKRAPISAANRMRRLAQRGHLPHGRQRQRPDHDAIGQQPEAPRQSTPSGSRASRGARRRARKRIR